MSDEMQVWVGFVLLTLGLAVGLVMLLVRSGEAGKYRRPGAAVLAAVACLGFGLML